MPVLGITGGIGTGKSTFARALLTQRPSRLFDADACARDLLEKSGEVRDRVGAAFGLPVGEPGQWRSLLRERVFERPDQRKILEAILHPEIRKQWISQAKACVSSGEWFFVDIPLLFETDAQSYFDRVIVVACSAEKQRARLLHSRKLSAALSEKIIASQLDLQWKISQADHVVWNDSTLGNLERQTALVLGWLKERYG